jgi:hypothetical protein
MSLILSGSGNPATVNGVDQGLTITVMTAQASTSGTVIDFTGIPSWAQRITVMFSGVSLTTGDNVLVQLGTSGGFVSSGYTTAVQWGSSSSGSSVAGFIAVLAGAGNALSGQMIISNITSTTWVYSLVARYGTNAITYGGGEVSIGANITSLRVTLTGGAFDAGTINVMYE